MYEKNPTKKHCNYMQFKTCKITVYFQDSLKCYVQRIFQGIISSSLLCPTNMCEVFYALKDIAHQYFKGRYIFK